MLQVNECESHDNIEAALVFAAESDVWEIRTTDVVTVRPSSYPTVPVGTVDSTDDDGICAALARGVPLDFVLAMAEAKGPSHVAKEPRREQYVRECRSHFMK